MGDSTSSKLVTHWRSFNLLLARGSPEEKVREFEIRNNVMLPLDFREYLLHVNGMLQAGGHDCDPNGFAFWPRARLRSVREESSGHSYLPYLLPGIPDPDGYFVFADYLQWCWAYVIRLGVRLIDGGQVIHVGKLRPNVLAASFTEFVNLYLRDARELYVEADEAQVGAPGS